MVDSWIITERLIMENDDLWMIMITTLVTLLNSDIPNRITSTGANSTHSSSSHWPASTSGTTCPKVRPSTGRTRATRPLQLRWRQTPAPLSRETGMRPCSWRAASSRAAGCRGDWGVKPTARCTTSTPSATTTGTCRGATIQVGWWLWWWPWLYLLWWWWWPWWWPWLYLL